MATSSKPARRAPRASAVATREAILQAALQQFSTYGFDAVSTRAIAGAAGIEQGHLAYYFPSKQALWQEMISSFNADFEKLLSDGETAIKGECPMAVAGELLPRILHFFASNRALTRLMLQEFSMQSSRHDWLVSEFGQPTWCRLEPLFKALAAKHSPPVRPEHLYFSFLGPALLYFGSSPEVATIVGGEPEGAAHDDAFISLQIQHLLKGAGRE